MKKLLLLLIVTLVNLTSSAQLTQDFEGIWPPAGWAVINESGPEHTWAQSELGNVNIPAYQGNHAAFMQRENVSAGTTGDWLITPQFTVPANGVVSFFSRTNYDEDQNTMYEVRISNGATQDAIGTYILVEDFTETDLTPAFGQYNQHVVNIPAAYTGQQVYLAFIMKGDMGDIWLLDNINIMSACTTPSGLQATNVTPTSATLQWDSNDALQWEIEFVPASLSFTGQGEILDQNFYDITDIVPGNYKFTVRAICNGVPSAWAEPVAFSTILNSENTVTGTVQYDVTGNGGCTGDGVGLPFIEIEVTVNDDYTYSTYTNVHGEFTLYNLPEGSTNISLQPVAPSGFDVATPVAQPVTFSAEDTEEVINICLGQPDIINDLSVTLIPTSSARPDQNASYMLTVSNTGTSVIDQATVTISFDDNRLDFVSAAVPATTAGNTLTITLANIMPFSHVQNEFIFYVLPPEINIGGEILAYTASVSMGVQDADMDNNTSVLNQIVVNSLDPNDITVHEGPQIYVNQAGDYLTYTIRFQNTGSAEAMTIKLENQLHEMLDADTFEPIMASHDFTVERTANALLFTFEDINLPNSTVDEPGSHGYVTYKVRPVEEIGLNDVVVNTANIYFDSNAVIPTNTVTTVVIENLGIEDNTVSNIFLYPNPVNDKLHISLKEGNVLSSAIVDINGRTIKTVKGNHSVIDTAGLASGLYLVQVTTDKGSSTYKIIKQ